VDFKDFTTSIGNFHGIVLGSGNFRCNFNITPRPRDALVPYVWFRSVNWCLIQTPVYTGDQRRPISSPRKLTFLCYVGLATILGNLVEYCAAACFNEVFERMSLAEKLNDLFSGLQPM